MFFKQKKYRMVTPENERMHEDVLYLLDLNNIKHRELKNVFIIEFWTTPSKYRMFVKKVNDLFSVYYPSKEQVVFL